MTRQALVLTGAILLAASQLLAQTPLSDEAVNKAIEQAVKYLYSAANANGIWDDSGPPNVPLERIDDFTQYNKGGYTALVLNALALAGQQNDPRFKAALKWLMDQPIFGTYSLALRLNLVHLLPQPETYREVVRRDTPLLLRGARPARNIMILWTYLPPPGRRDYGVEGLTGDYSNVNYAVLGLWAASDERMEIPNEAWLGLERTWVLGQNPHGGWGYVPLPFHVNEPEHNHVKPRGSMTAAGIASLYLVMDYAYAGKGPLGSYRNSAAYASIQRGLKWLGENFSARTNPGADRWFSTYYFYNCERVGAAGGLKYLGTHDWFRDIAAFLLARQQADGSIRVDTEDQYGGALTDTAFALMFLTKGSAPIIVNKLQHSGDWDNRLREPGALTDWLARQSERPANWQVVDLQAAAEDLTDSRLLYIAGAKPLELAPEEKAKLKRFVELGGMLVFHPDGTTVAFPNSVRKLAAELWPELEFSAVDLAKHPLGNVFASAQGQGLRVEQLASPVRILAVMLHGSPAAAWERRQYNAARHMFAIGANLHYYANDRALLRDMPTRLSYFAQDFRTPVPQGGLDLPLARIRYAENPHRWNPEPLAFERFARLLATRERIRLDVSVLAPGDLAQTKARVAHLTGTGAVEFSAADADALTAFVKGGGTLLVDQAGGPRDDSPGTFDAAFRKFVAARFGPDALDRMPADHPYLAGLGRLSYRHVGGSRRTRIAPRLECAALEGRAAVIYSQYDLTCGLLGCPNPRVSGAMDDAAYEIMSRLVRGAAGMLPKAAATQASPE